MKFEILAFLSARRNFTVKTSNLIRWFCLKDELVEQKIYTAVSCPGREGLWKVPTKCEW